MDNMRERLEILGKALSPDRPIQSLEFLRGRQAEYERIVQELSFFHSIPFIYGDRGVGKTSLARTAAQQVTSADREPIYVACAPRSRMLTIFREISNHLIALAFKLGLRNGTKVRTEYNLSLTNPSLRVTLEKGEPQICDFRDANDAINTLKDIDRLLSDFGKTIVIIDELEELSEEDRIHLAFLIKQIGDQNFSTHFVLVGIATNVQELVGAHHSVPRYTHEVSLSPLSPQSLMEIVSEAAEKVKVRIERSMLLKIAIVGNGYPHFAHLIGKSLLHEAIANDENVVTDNIFKSGIARAVNSSIEELKNVYNSATQRQDDAYKYLIWALADCDAADMRINDLIVNCRKLSDDYGWTLPSDETLRNRIQRLGTEGYGKIIMNTPVRYGDSNMRYRYKRFSSSLMRSHVRLVAQAEGITLGRTPSL